MKKEDVYVVIDSDEKRLRAIQILTDAGESIWSYAMAMEFDNDYNLLTMNLRDKEWLIDNFSCGETEITLDELEEILPRENKILEQKTKGIIDMFRRHAYPFAAGSGFMTGEFCEETILKGAKELAAIHAQGIADNIGQDHPKWSFWVGVVDAIKNYSEVDPNQLVIDGLN